jgi:site-specific DNA-cytosine methylase
MPMPGDVDTAGPMHSIPGLSWKNWVRLALIPAGGDWRDLPGVLVDGEKRREKFRRAPVTAWSETAETVTGPGGSSSTNVADPRIADAVALADNPGRHWNKFAVTEWTAPAQTVTGTDTRVGSGAPSVADPRWGGGRLGVAAWDAPGATVTGESYPSNGANAVADPRIAVDSAYRGVFGVSAWDEVAATVTGNGRVNSGRFSVADPRFADGKKKNWQQVAGVTPWTEAAPTVISGAKIHAGAFQVADPRIHCRPRAGAYRVLRWDEAAATITGSLAIDNGAAAIADPRLRADRPPPFTPLIIAADNTWHRPLTTLELAVLQSFPAMIDGKPLVLAGTSHTRWREAIGNAVPPLAALHIAAQLLRALLISALGAFEMSNNPV